MTRSIRIAPTSAAFTFLLGVFAGLPALSIDLSAPTLVELPSALGTTTTVAGLTLSLFMLGFALGQLAGGRASDRFGRRPVLLGSLLVYTLTGAACALAGSGPMLVASRLVQGAAAGGCAVLAFAMVQDLFEGEAARSRRSYVTVVLGITPVLAPALGAFLAATFGWRSVHFALASAGCLFLGLVFLAVPETRAGLLLRSAQGSVRLRDDRRFLGLAIVNGLSYGAVFAYITGAPIIIMGDMGYPGAVYAGLFAATALALSAGAWVSGRIGRHGLGAARLAWLGLAAQACGCVALALHCTSAHPCRPELAVPLLLLTCFARGVVAPNMIHLAIGSRRTDAGFASAMIGVVQLTLGAAASASVAFLLPRVGQAGLGTPMALAAGGAAVLWLVMARRDRSMVARAADAP
ncbi:MAG: multidrug effflux MFS transporter [Acetobacteraceae bacterium]|nr:multidrug effflux MFS transporter [Acetobacteraceae bacterium]